MTLKKFIFLMLAVCLVGSVCAVPAMADGYYKPVTVGIGVGGTGHFYLQAVEPTKDLVGQERDFEGYGEFIMEYYEPGEYHYVLGSGDAINSCRYSVIVSVNVDKVDDVGILYPSVSIMPLGEDRKVQVAYFPTVVVDPPVRKVVTGEGAPTDTAFYFDFKAVSTTVERYRNNLPMPDGSNGQTKELKVIGSGSVESGDIVFSEPGQYVYEFTERDTGESGYTYDKSVYRIAFDIIEGAKGYEVKQTITKDGVETNAKEIVFTNAWSRGGGSSHNPFIKTGDMRHIGAWTLATAASAAMAISLAVLVSKKGRREENN